MDRQRRAGWIADFPLPAYQMSEVTLENMHAAAQH
jgi:hypothetical protein